MPSAQARPVATPSAVLALQRSAGNASIARVLGAQRGPSTALAQGGPLLQRTRLRVPGRGPNARMSKVRMAKLRTSKLGSKESSVVLRGGQVAVLLSDLGDEVLVKDPSGARHTIAKDTLRIAPGRKLVLLGQIVRVVDVQTTSGRNPTVVLQDQYGELVGLAWRSVLALQRVPRDRLRPASPGELSRMPLRSAIAIATKTESKESRSGRRGATDPTRSKNSPPPKPSLSMDESDDVVIPEDVPEVTPLEIGPTIVDRPGGERDGMGDEPVELSGPTTGSTTGTSLGTSPDERKARARTLFEAWIGTGRTVVEIDAALPHLARQCGLDKVSLQVTDTELIIGYHASPPLYTHLALSHVAPDLVEHPLMGAKYKKGELTATQYDKGLDTPLGAIMKQLGLKAEEVNLLVKGDLLKADRPRSVSAIVVGTRRTKGGRVGGDTVPAAIAHLGHHEHMILRNDENAKKGFYDGGHLIGDQLMKSTGPDTFVEWNLAPMEQVLNQQSYFNWCEQVIRAGGFDDEGDENLKVPISVIAQVTYPDSDYTVKESKLAEHGIVPEVKTGSSDRDVRIPARVPYRWQLEAKLLKTGYTFKEKSQAKDKIKKLGNTAFPYYNYNDLTTNEIPWSERHWWVLKTSSLAEGKLTAHTDSGDMVFDSYQYYPPRS